MAEKVLEGCLINLDEAEGSVINYDFVDDFRRPCRILNITFGSPMQLFFKNDGSTFFRAMNANWEPYKLEEQFDGTVWVYTCQQCHPVNSFVINTQLIEDTKKLTEALELELTDNSEVMEIPIPLKNVSLLRLVWELRKQSYELNSNDLSQAIMYFYDGTAAISGTLDKLLSGEATDLTGLSEQFFQKYLDNRYDLFWDIEIENLKGMSSFRWMNKLVKRCITVETAFPLRLFSNYTIPEAFSHSELPTSMVCIRQIADSRRQTNPYLSVLAELEYKEE